MKNKEKEEFNYPDNHEEHNEPEVPVAGSDGDVSADFTHHLGELRTKIINSLIFFLRGARLHFILFRCDHDFFQLQNNGRVKR